MKTTKECNDTTKRGVSVNVDALLKAINEICENKIHRNLDDPKRVSVNGRDYHIWHELADVFGLDIHGFSMSEINR